MPVSAVCALAPNAVKPTSRPARLTVVISFLDSMCALSLSGSSERPMFGYPCIGGFRGECLWRPTCTLTPPAGDGRNRAVPSRNSAQKPTLNTAYGATTYRSFATRERARRHERDETAARTAQTAVAIGSPHCASLTLEGSRNITRDRQAKAQKKPRTFVRGQGGFLHQWRNTSEKQPILSITSCTIKALIA